MLVEQALKDRIQGLIEEGSRLSRGDEYGRVMDAEHANECVGWLGAADHALGMVCPSAHNSYKQAAMRIVEYSKTAGYCVNEPVGQFVALLKRLMDDVNDGLITSVADQARIETLDDLLDQAEEYHRSSRLDGSGILATAIFEDTVRRIARMHDIFEAGVKMDDLISSLGKAEVITSIVAKRCRAAAAVRNKALHAQWEEVTLDDVGSVIALTRKLLEDHAPQ